jgi:hypothetical protein
MAGIIVLLVTIILIILTLHKPQPKQEGSGLRYYDPRSGETITDPLGKTKDVYGSAPDVPDVLGISKLTAYGLSQQQLGFTQDAFTKFARSQNPKVKIISINVSDITHTKVNPRDVNSHDLLLFNIQLDLKKLLDAKLEFHGLKQVRLRLYKDRTLVYDSGELGNSGSAIPHND